jgi:hypothetical protein
VDLEYPLPPIEDVTPTEDEHVPTTDDLDFITKNRLANNASLAVLTYCTEIRLLMQII